MDDEKKPLSDKFPIPGEPNYVPPVHVPTGYDIASKVTDNPYLGTALATGIDAAMTFGPAVLGVASGGIKTIGTSLLKGHETPLETLDIIHSPERAALLDAPQKEQYLDALEKVYGPRDQRAEMMGFNLKDPKWHSFNKGKAIDTDPGFYNVFTGDPVGKKVSPNAVLRSDYPRSEITMHSPGKFIGAVHRGNFSQSTVPSAANRPMVRSLDANFDPRFKASPDWMAGKMMSGGKKDDPQNYASGGIVSEDTVNVTDPMGKVGSLPKSQLSEALENNYRIASPEEVTSAKNEERYGDAAGMFASGVLGAARSATLGASDIALQHLPGDMRFSPEELRGYEETNPVSNMAGQFIGVLEDPMGLAKAISSAGKATGMGAKALLNTAKTAEDASLATKTLSSALGYGTEGALYGGIAGSAHDYALGDPQENSERIMSNIGYGALIGGTAGGSFKLLGYGVGPGLKKAADAIVKTRNELVGSGFGEEALVHKIMPKRFADAIADRQLNLDTKGQAATVKNIVNHLNTATDSIQSEIDSFQKDMSNHSEAMSALFPKSDGPTTGPGDFRDTGMKFAAEYAKRGEQAAKEMVAKGAAKIGDMLPEGMAKDVVSGFSKMSQEAQIKVLESLNLAVDKIYESMPDMSGIMRNAKSKVVDLFNKSPEDIMAARSPDDIFSPQHSSMSMEDARKAFFDTYNESNQALSTDNIAQQRAAASAYTKKIYMDLLRKVGPEAVRLRGTVLRRAPMDFVGSKFAKAFKYNDFSMNVAHNMYNMADLGASAHDIIADALQFVIDGLVNHETNLKGIEPIMGEQVHKLLWGIGNAANKFGSRAGEEVSSAFNKAKGPVSQGANTFAGYLGTGARATGKGASKASEVSFNYLKELSVKLSDLFKKEPSMEEHLGPIQEAIQTTMKEPGLYGAAPAASAVHEEDVSGLRKFISENGKAPTEFQKKFGKTVGNKWKFDVHKVHDIFSDTNPDSRMENFSQLSDFFDHLQSMPDNILNAKRTIPNSSWRKETIAQVVENAKKESTDAFHDYLDAIKKRRPIYGWKDYAPVLIAKWHPVLAAAIEAYDFYQDPVHAMHELALIERIIGKTTKRTADLVQKIFNPVDYPTITKGTEFIRKSTSGQTTDNDEEQMNKIKQMANNPQHIADNVSKSIDGIKNSAPNISQHLHLAAQNASGFLASKLPQNSDHLNPLGEPYKPSTNEITKFHNYLKIVEDPLHSLEQIHDRTITHATVEAMSMVYPKLYDGLKQNLLEKAFMHKQKGKVIPFQTRQAISTFLGEPIEQALQPQSILANQMVLMTTPKPGEVAQTKTRAKGLDKMDRADRAGADYGAMSDKV